MATANPRNVLCTVKRFEQKTGNFFMQQPSKGTTADERDQALL